MVKDVASQRLVPYQGVIERVTRFHSLRPRAPPNRARATAELGRHLDLNSLWKDLIMNGSKRYLFGFCAVIVGVISLLASTAQAALSWLILNSAGTTATELKAELVAEKDTSDITLLTKELGLKIAITCTNIELPGFNLEVSGKLTEGGKIKLTGCEAYGKGTLEEALGCHIHSTGQPSGTILSNELKGELVSHEVKGGGRRRLWRIIARILGALFNALSEECAIPESNAISGELFLQDCEAKEVTHAVKHLLEQGPLTSLFVGKDTAEHLETSLDGSFWVKLGGAHAGLKWSAMEA
jgi:hypothetical protein